MGSEKCLVMFSQLNTEMPSTFLGVQLSLSQTSAPGKKSNADELQTGSACLKTDSSGRAPFSTSTQHSVMDGVRG